MTDSDARPNWAEVKRVFAAAAELPDSERPEFLARNCTDPRVRHEVEALLSVTDTCARQLDNVPDAAPAEDLELPAGTRIDDYVIIERIGSGGMSAGVFRAHDERHDREVALKILRLHQTPQRVAEQRILGRLQHANIATLYDSGVSESGRPYLAMEYVCGRRIDRHCCEEGLSVNDRLRLVAQVCDGLAHAHRRSIVHRDLKPSNILVTVEGTPKILDFGIAKVLDIEDLTLTNPEQRAISIPFASPEQVAGGEMQPGSDVYSLGVLLYHLLTGRLPFEADSAMALYTNTVRQQPLALRAIARRRTGFTLESGPEGSDDYFVGSFSPDLEGVLLKAVDIDLARRYASVDVLRDDLLGVIEGRPVSARRQTALTRTARLARRYRPALLTAGALVAGLVLYGYLTPDVHLPLERPAPFSLSGYAYCDTEPPPSTPAVQLDWTPARGATTHAIVRDGELYHPNVESTSFQNEINVEAGRSYTYSIRARNAHGVRDSNSVEIAVPADVCR